MIQHHLFARVLAIAGATAAVTLAAVNVVPVRAAVPVETIEVTADASVRAVRLNPPTTTTTPRPGTTVPAALVPVECGTPLNQFGTARSGGRTHQGEDIAAPQNTPVLAVVAGTLYRQIVDGADSSSLSGNAWYLRDDVTKAYYFYAHLDHFADLPVGTVVRAGDVIGYVGDTGNPGPGNYHLHFEVHPSGTDSVINPKPLLAMPRCPTA
jgi:hypothetical protein